MKTKILLIAALVLALSLPAALNVRAMETKDYAGVLIDTHCLKAHSADLKAFASMHTKKCVLEKGCKESGMNLILADGTVLKFDKESSDKIAAFLDKPDSKLNVVVSAMENPDKTMMLMSIKNQ
jgi:hypothetical protein